jgi:branched-subunit amino acid transport protein
MDSTLWLAVFGTAAGTFCMRLLPLLWMQRHLDRHNDKDAFEVMPQWLSILGPLMIAAMLGVSLVPKSIDFISWITTACGVLVTVLIWRHTRSLGLPVLAGVLAFGIVNVTLGI